MNKLKFKKQCQRWLEERGNFFLTSKIQSNKNLLYFLNKLYKNDLSLSEKLYWLLNDIDQKPKCVICGLRDVSRYLGLNKGYTEKCYKCCFVSKNTNKRKRNLPKNNNINPPYRVKLSNRMFDRVQSLTNHIRHSYPSILIGYMKENNIDQIPKCKRCGKDAKLKSFLGGFDDYCSAQCKFLYKKENNIIKNRKIKQDDGYYNFILKNKKWYVNNLYKKNINDLFYNKNIGNILLKSFISANIKKELYVIDVCVICKIRTKRFFIEKEKITCGLHKNYATIKPFLIKEKDINNHYINLRQQNISHKNAKKNLKNRLISDLDNFKIFYIPNVNNVKKIITCPVTGYLIPIVPLTNHFDHHLNKFKINKIEYIKKYFPNLINVCDNCNKFMNINFKFKKNKKFCCSECYWDYKRNHPEEYKPSKEQREKQSLIMKEKILRGEFTPNVTNSWANSKITFKIKNCEYNFRSTWEAVFFILNPHLLYESKRIKYFNSVEQTYRNYIIDFEDIENRILYEIKPKSNKNDIIVKDKEEYAKMWCMENNYTFVFIDDDYFFENANKIDYIIYPKKIYNGMRNFLNDK